MPISSIIRGGVSGTSAVLGGAAQGGSDAFAALFQRAREATTSTAGASATASASVGNLTREVESQFSEFKRAVQQVLAAAGIDTNWPIELTSNGIGGINVHGDHPDQDKIAALLQANPDLIDKFHSLQEAYRALRTSSDPASPEGLPQTFRITFDGDQAQVQFE